MKHLTIFITLLFASFSLSAQYLLTRYGANTGTQGSYSSYFGAYAGQSALSSSNSNTLIGVNTGKSISSGKFNTFTGRNAGIYTTTGLNNSFYGVNAGFSNSTGNYNSFLGTAAGFANTIGTRNVFVGNTSGRFNTTGTDNTFIGMSAGYGNTTGNYNTYIGRQAGGGNQLGSHNVKLGYTAGYNETGSHKLYIDNSSTATPLIKGDFAADALTFNGTVGVGADVPAGNNIQLFVDGRFTQRVAGNLGNFLLGNRWSSLGDSPVSSIYGMFNQGYGASFVSGSKSSGTNIGNNIIGFSGGRLDFDVIGANGPTQSRVSILNNGNVGIGTTNPGSYRLFVAGNAYATGSWVSSDKRYKKDIKTIESASDKIKAIQGVTYGFKQKTINDIDFSKMKQGNHLGIIAQDLEKVFPELVRQDDAGYYAVNYDGLVPVLIEALKEQLEVAQVQKEEIKEQQVEITDLKARMNKLETLINASSKTTQNSRLSAPTENTNNEVILRQNAPNPFSKSTIIEYQLPDNAEAGTLVVSDLNGRTIANYNIVGKGTIEFSANELANGTYIYTISTNGRNLASRKMIVQK